MSPEDDTTKVILRGCDDAKVEVAKYVCEQSEFLRNQLEEIENADDSGEILVPKVEGPILELIVKFISYYAETPLNPIVHPIEGDTIEDVR